MRPQNSEHYARRAARFARLRARREVAILARPPPEYPPALPASGEWLAGYVHGRLTVIHLSRDARHRSDQWAAELDGQVLTTAAGLTVLCDKFRHALGRPIPRRAYGAMQQGYSARDEQDAAAAQGPD